MTKALFLDTTIQVDRILQESSPELLASLLSQYDYLMTCSLSRLEFKRVVIQNISLVLGYLKEEKSFFGALARAKSIGAFRPRRMATLISVYAWIGRNSIRDFEGRSGDENDRLLALRAESYLRNAITFLWKRFDATVDSIADRTKCRRAEEPPMRRSNGTFDSSIARSKCQSRQCENANFFQSKRYLLEKLHLALEKLPAESETRELTKARETIKRALKSPSILYDYNACCSLGDVWLHLEAMSAGVADFATTNYKESGVLCPQFGLQMRQPN